MKIIYLTLKVHTQINSCLLNESVIQGNSVECQPLFYINYILQPIFMLIYYLFFMPFCWTSLLSWLNIIFDVQQGLSAEQWLIKWSFSDSCNDLLSAHSVAAHSDMVLPLPHLMMISLPRLVRTFLCLVPSPEVANILMKETKIGWFHED